MFYNSDSRERPEDDEVRRSLTGITDSTVLVRAGSPLQACLKFVLEWDAVKTGLQHAAMFLDRGRMMEEYPGCERLHKNGDGTYICGPEVGEDGNGEFGGCVLSHFDPPDFYCPIDRCKVRELREVQEFGVNCVRWVGMEERNNQRKDFTFGEDAFHFPEESYWCVGHESTRRGTVISLDENVLCIQTDDREEKVVDLIETFAPVVQC